MSTTVLPKPSTERKKHMSTMRSVMARFTAACMFLTVLPISLGGASAHATECDNVDISVTNDHPSGDPIKVLYIEYYVSDGLSWFWQEEGLANKVPNPGATVTWNNQDLRIMQEGDATSWRVYFKRQLTGGFFPTYDDPHYQEFDRTDHPCDYEGSYSFKVDEYGHLAE